MSDKHHDETIAAELKEMEFCVFDLETTGGSHKDDKIIEIGLIKIQGLKIVEEKDFLIQPEIKIPSFIQKLTSINQNDVEDAPIIDEVIDEIVDFMGEAVLVAHNTSFDVPFFNSVLTRLSRPELTNKSMCTNLMTKYMIPNLMNSNLNYMCNIFGIEHKRNHRALDDARACSHLLLKYLKIFVNKNIKKINHLYYPRNRYELDRTHYKCGEFKTEDIEAKLYRLKSPFLLTMKGENGIILFAYPCAARPSEIELLKKYLNSYQWETTTIQLYGSFLESFIHFASLAKNMDSTTKNSIMNILTETYCPQNKAIKAPPLFVVTNHLVPEQLVIYPVPSIFSKRELVFRYPSHYKRLLKYISLTPSLRTTHQGQKNHIDVDIKKFIQRYLENSAQEDDTFLIFDKKDVLKKPEVLFKQIDLFLSHNPNSSNYPKHYI